MVGRGTYNKLPNPELLGERARLNSDLLPEHTIKTKWLQLLTNHLL